MPKTERIDTDKLTDDDLLKTLYKAVHADERVFVVTMNSQQVELSGEFRDLTKRFSFRELETEATKVVVHKKTPNPVPRSGRAKWSLKKVNPKGLPDLPITPWFEAAPQTGEEALEQERTALLDQIANSDGTSKYEVERLLVVEQMLYLARTEYHTSNRLNAINDYSPSNPAEPAARWRKEKKIFGVKIENKWHYPAFQFDGGTAKPIIRQILKVLPENWGNWEVAFWFQSPNGLFEDSDAPQDRLNDRTILDVAAREAEPVGY